MNLRPVSLFLVLTLGSLVVTGGAVLAQNSEASTSVELTKARVTIDVKDTDINRVLDAFAQQTGLNIVVGKEVTGTVTVKLSDVPWDRALDAILKPSGFGAERSGDIVVILPLTQLKELSESQPLSSRVFKLVYRDAGDIRPVIEAQLSPRGKVEVVEETGQKGWDFGAFGASGSGAQAIRSSVGTASAPRRSYKGSIEKRSRTKTLVVTDVATVLERVAEVIEALDVIPQQVLIEARFMEVNRDFLRDIDPGLVTGATAGSSSLSVKNTPGSKQAGAALTELAGTLSPTDFTPATFLPKTSGLTAAVAGANIFFQKLHGSQYSALLRLLEEDVRTNTLSAPSILTLDNQEANILVGTQYPILTSSVAGTTSTTTVTSLDYYQDIGVQLRVVPQISGKDRINMIVHPSVSSFSSTLAAKSAEGTTLAEYPILTTRETETQILMKTGETIMIGGLLKDVKSKSHIGIPFLSKIPILGYLFRRTTDDIEKVDLLIFITAYIADEKQVATQIPVFQPDAPGPKSKVHWEDEPKAPKTAVPPMPAASKPTQLSQLTAETKKEQ